MPVKNFSKQTYKEITLPNLLLVQRESYDWFWKKGLRELFDEVSPIRDYGGKDIDLWFEDYRLDETKYTELNVRDHNAT